MKHLYLLLLLLPLCLSAETVTDTVTNWQVYKDGKLLLKSYETNPKIHTIEIDASENFRELKIYINDDMPAQNVRRKLMFKANKALTLSAVRALKSSDDPIIFSKTELLKFIGPDTNKLFTVEFTDDIGSTGTILFRFILKNI